MRHLFPRFGLLTSILTLSCLGGPPASAQIGRSVAPVVLSPEFQQAKKMSNGIFVLSDGVTVVLRQRGGYLIGARLLVSEKLSGTQNEGQALVTETQKNEESKSQAAPISGLALQRLSYWAGVLSGYGAGVQEPLQQLLMRPDLQQQWSAEPFVVRADPLRLSLERKAGVLSVDMTLQKMAEKDFWPSKNALESKKTPSSVTIRIFSDFQCPFCQQFEQNTWPMLLKVLPEDTRVEFHHLPLEAIHPLARSAAEISECAAQQGKFWPYKDALFEKSNWDAWQKGNPNTVFLQLAEQQGLDMRAFKDCIAERAGKEQVDASVAAAIRLGVQATPTVYVGGYALPRAGDIKALIELLGFVRATELALPTPVNTPTAMPATKTLPQPKQTQTKQPQTEQSQTEKSSKKDK